MKSTSRCPTRDISLSNVSVFMLVVRDNCGHANTIAAFMIQTEEADKIDEAIRIIRETCPDLNPDGWITDKCGEEVLISSDV